jgi:phage shock protein A
VKPAPAAAPANFPKVDTSTQKDRDAERRKILEQELANEQKLLDGARKELAEQEAVRLGSERNYQRVLDRLEPYKKKVKLHEDNVESLNKELRTLR